MMFSKTKTKYLLSFLILLCAYFSYCIISTKSTEQYRINSLINLGSYWDSYEVKSISVSEDSRSISFPRDIENRLSNINLYCPNFSFADTKSDNTIQVIKEGNDILKLAVFSADKGTGMRCALDISSNIVQYNKENIFDKKHLELVSHQKGLKALLSKSMDASDKLMNNYFHLKIANEIDSLQNKTQYPYTVSPSIVSFEIIRLPSSVTKKLLVLICLSLVGIIFLIYQYNFKSKQAN